VGGAIVTATARADRVRRNIGGYPSKGTDMANEASGDSAMAPEARVSWFRAGGERPVNGGGNTVFVRPVAEPVEDSAADDE